MASSTGVAPPTPPNAPAVGGGDALKQQLVEVTPPGNSDSPGNATPMNPLLLASVCAGSSAALNFLFDREDQREPAMMVPTQVFLDKLAWSSTGRTLTVPQASDDLETGVDEPPAAWPAAAAASHDAAEDGVDQPPALPAAAAASDGVEDGLAQPPRPAASDVLEDSVDQPPSLPARPRLLQGVTAEGDTALHVVATHGDSTEFLECASIINTRDKDLQFVVNRRGDTPLHCVARSGNFQMLSLLIQLAGTGDRMHEFLRKENVLKETALHEAIRVGNKDIVKRLLKADPLLANFPDHGTSPLYLAILQGGNAIAEVLHDMSDGNLSYDGPHGKSALHAATCRDSGITKLVLNWNNSLTARGDRDGSTPLHLASSFKYPYSFMQLFKANPAAVYQADSKGLFPIHVAASVGAEKTIRIILEKFPSSAGLCTAQGRTFLHVAVEKRRLNIVSFVCRTVSLAWILNMRDKDGNTALHLAVQTGGLRIFCSLYGNKQVLLSSANNNEEAPVNLSIDLIPSGLQYNWNSDNRIYVALAFFGTNDSCLRWDQYEEKYSRKLESMEKVKEEEKVKDASQILGIGSVLIATVAFGATFAVPGGFIEDDHTNRGTPTLAGRFTFDAFMMANALAFICSSIATVGLMFAGTSLVNLGSRQVNLTTSVFFMSSSVTSLSAAFALGVYMVLAPVAHATGIAICVISPLVVLYRSLEVFIKLSILARPLYLRLGPIRALKWLVGRIIFQFFKELWPFILIFGWATIARKLRNR